MVTEVLRSINVLPKWWDRWHFFGRVHLREEFSVLSICELDGADVVNDDVCLDR